MQIRLSFLGATQEVLDLGPHLFVVLRRHPTRGSALLALCNVTGGHVDVDLPQSLPPDLAGPLTDALTGDLQATGPVHLAPFQTRWLEPGPEEKRPKKTKPSKPTCSPIPKNGLSTLCSLIWPVTMSAGSQNQKASSFPTL